MTVLYKVSSVLWVIWGLVHIMAGIFTINFVLSGDIAGAVSGIADAIDPPTLQMDYPDAAGAVIGQHGFNLGWIGIVTFVSALYVWKGDRKAILLVALTGGLADLGYFLFMDLGGYVNFVPGTIMTIISSVAIILSFYASFLANKE